jgi:GxxExxY protein
MNTDKHRKGLLHEGLTYKVRGAIFAIRKEYDPGQKEVIYQRLLYEKLTSSGSQVEREKKISIYSSDTGKVVGIYQPDLVVDEAILLELKSSRFSSVQDEKQLYYYLRNSKYEVGLLVNFSTPRLFIKRIIYTNDRKPYLRIER